MDLNFIDESTRSLAGPMWKSLGQGDCWDDVLAVCLILITTLYLSGYRIGGKDPYHHLWFEYPQNRRTLDPVSNNTNVAQILKGTVSGKDWSIAFYAHRC